MTVGNLGTGKNGGGLAAYLLASHDNNGDERPRADKIGGTLMGDTAKAIGAEMKDFQQLRPTVTKYVAHMSINFSPEDRELTDKEQVDICQFWAEGMGFDGYVSFSHGDHCHVLASRIKLDGSVVSDSNDWAKSERLIRQIEEKWDLVRVDSSHLLEPDNAKKASISMSEIGVAEKGEEPVKRQLIDMLDDLLSEDRTASEFVEHLEAAGVDVRPNISNTTDKLSGFSYGYGGYTFTSKHLGRAYSLKNLESKGLEYEPNRDSERLREARAKSESRQLDRSTAAAEQRHSDSSRDARRDSGSDLAADRGASKDDANTGQITEASRERKPTDEHPGVASVGRTDGAEQKSESQPVEGGGQAGGSEERTELGSGSTETAEVVAESPAVSGGVSSKPHSNGGGGSPGCSMASQSSAVLDTVILEGDDFEALVRYFRKWSAAMKKQQDQLQQARKLAGAAYKPPSTKFNPAPGSAYDNIINFAGTGKYKRRDQGIAKQLAAFGVDNFEIQAIPHKGSSLGKDSVRRVDAQGALKLASYMSQKNAKGYDIYVRPAPIEIDGQQHGAPYVFIDDIQPAQMKRLKETGLPLAVTMESSPGNFQGWVRVGAKPLPAEELSAAAKILAKSFGGDPGAADWRHYGRLAGFTNQKPQRRQANGYAPFVQLNTQNGHDIAKNGPALMQAARQHLDNEAAQLQAAQEKVATDRQNRAQQLLQGQLMGSDVYQAVAEARERLRKGQDESATDFAAAMSALRKGYDPDDVEQALKACSPDLAKRKQGNVNEYLRRTVERAQAQIGTGPKLG